MHEVDNYIGLFLSGKLNSTATKKPKCEHNFMQFFPISLISVALSLIRIVATAEIH